VTGFIRLLPKNQNKNPAPKAATIISDKTAITPFLRDFLAGFGRGAAPPRAGATGGRAGSAAAPQEPQNLASGFSGAPQFPQNFPIGNPSFI